MKERLAALFPVLYKFFILKGNDVDVAYDLAVETYEKGLRQAYSYDPGKASVKTWIFYIAKNSGINYWRTEKNRREILAKNQIWKTYEDQSPEDVAILNEENQLLVESISKLDQKSKMVVALKFSANMTNREISQITGLGESNIGVILFRAMKSLKSLLVEKVK